MWQFHGFHHVPNYSFVGRDSRGRELLFLLTQIMCHSSGTPPGILPEQCFSLTHRHCGLWGLMVTVLRSVIEYPTRSHLQEGGFGSEFEDVLHYGRSCLSIGRWHSCDDKHVSCRAHKRMHQEAEEVGVVVLIRFRLPLFSFVLDSSPWDTLLCVCVCGLSPDLSLSGNVLTGTHKVYLTNILGVSKPKPNQVYYMNIES